MKAEKADRAIRAAHIAAIQADFIAKIAEKALALMHPSCDVSGWTRGAIAYARLANELTAEADAEMSTGDIAAAAETCYMALEAAHCVTTAAIVLAAEYKANNSTDLLAQSKQMLAETVTLENNYIAGKIALI